MPYLSAFLIGFLGSLHCIGMCGPITLALPGKPEKRFSFVAGRFLYNIGRIITYSFMGFLFGLLGSRIQLLGLQQIASIIIGGGIIIYLILPKSFKEKFYRLEIIEDITDTLKSMFNKFLKKDSISSLYIIGILNGFLPCGLVYIAIAGAIATGTMYDGFLFMFFFGLGTFPVMFATSLIASFISFKARLRIRKLIPVFALLIAIMFVLRGLNLGIPYISPHIEASKVEDVESIKCH